MRKSFRSGSRERELGVREFNPEDAVARMELLDEGGENLIINFRPWHGGGEHEEGFERRMIAEGYDVVSIEVDERAINQDPHSVRESFEVVQGRAVSFLNSTVEAKEYKRKIIVAKSLGNVAASMTIIGGFDDFDGATFVVNGTELAGSLWFGKRTQHLRRAMEQNGHSLEDVRRHWKQLNSLNIVEALEGKEVEALVSSADEIIISSHQEQFARALARAGIDPVIKNTRLGHYPTIGFYDRYGTPSELDNPSGLAWSRVSEVAGPRVNGYVSTVTEFGQRALGLVQARRLRPATLVEPSALKES